MSKRPEICSLTSPKRINAIGIVSRDFLPLYWSPISKHGLTNLFPISPYFLQTPHNTQSLLISQNFTCKHRCINEPMASKSDKRNEYKEEKGFVSFTLISSNLG
ncbi:hypothetical protein QL285_008907 [Trifolium repens]|nr:hypothetical protein QL285_008907 [Trifolium repens]